MFQRLLKKQTYACNVQTHGSLQIYRGVILVTESILKHCSSDTKTENRKKKGINKKLFTCLNYIQWYFIQSSRSTPSRLNFCDSNDINAIVLRDKHINIQIIDIIRRYLIQVNITKIISGSICTVFVITNLGSNHISLVY